MFEAQRKRRWEQALDCMVTLSNYANSKKTDIAIPKSTNYLPINTSDASLHQNIVTQTNIELLKSMVPFLPTNLQTFGTEKAAKLLLEITQCVKGTEQKEEVQQHHHHQHHPHLSKRAFTPNAPSVPQTTAIDRERFRRTVDVHQYSSSTSLKVQCTPFLMRKETEWWNNKHQGTLAKSNRSKSSRRYRTTSTKRVESPRVRAHRIPSSPQPLQQSPRTIRQHRVETRPLELEKSDRFAIKGLPKLRK